MADKDYQAIYEKARGRSEGISIGKAQEKIGLAKIKAEQKQFGSEQKSIKTNIKKIFAPPQQQVILSKSQQMLQSLFGEKRQFWGNGEPVQINNTLTSGNGLIRTGSGDATRRLFLP